MSRTDYKRHMAVVQRDEAEESHRDNEVSVRQQTDEEKEELERLRANKARNYSPFETLRRAHIDARRVWK